MLHPFTQFASKAHVCVDIRLNNGMTLLNFLTTRIIHLYASLNNKKSRNDADRVRRARAFCRVTMATAELY